MNFCGKRRGYADLLRHIHGLAVCTASRYASVVTSELFADSPNADVGTVSPKEFAQCQESWDVASLGQNSVARPVWISRPPGWNRESAGFAAWRSYVAATGYALDLTVWIL